jgi:acyl carrier protein
MKKRIIYELISECCGVKQEFIRDEAYFTYDYGMDECELRELIIKSEEIFKTIVPEEEITNIQKVADLIYCFI